MQTSASIAAIAAALAKAQGDFPPIPKGKTAKAGPYSYDYADLADMIATLAPVLSANGLSVVQDAAVEFIEGLPVVEVSTTILHGSGEFLTTGCIRLKADNKPQSVGICTTYARRYSYGAALGVSPEADTDGSDDHATDRKAPKAQPTAAKPPAPKPDLATRKAAVVKELQGYGFEMQGVKLWVKEVLGQDKATTSEDCDKLDAALVLLRAEKNKDRAADLQY